MDGDSDRQTALRSSRIVLRPLASPLPLGFFAFGIGSALVSARQFGVIPDSQAVSLAVLLAVFVFPLELLAGIFALLARETAGATALGLIAFSWPATAAVTILAAPGDPTSTVAGLFYLGIAAALALLAVPALRAKPLLGAVIVLAVGRYGLNGVYELTRTAVVADVSGFIGLLILALALYGGLALLLEDAQHHTVLPFPRFGEADAAMEETDFSAEVEAVTREAGVRRQL